MESIRHILLANAVGAAVLAAVVWGVCWACRRPAICRAMWIVVLLKLLAPPVVSVPVYKWLGHREVGRAEVRAAEPVAAVPISGLADPGVVARVDDSGVSNAPAQTRTQTWTQTWTLRALSILPIVWGAGTLALLAVGMIRVVVLLRLLGGAPTGDESVQDMVRWVSARLGVRTPPTVCFVRGVVCPALWAFGRRPRVVVPQILWDRLDGAGRRTLLAHELAHLRRGDHWVRLLEFVAAVIYWWHPAVWVARRQIHDYEEQCCDAWVLWAMPASARSYGSALLEAVDFVSTARPMRPALSAGLGEFRHLKRRLLMIKQGTVSRALSRTGMAAVFGAAAVVLPLTAGFGQESAPQAVPALPGAAPAGAAEAAPGNPAEIAEARARVAKLQRDLAEAMRRLASLEHGSAPSAGTGGYGMSYSVPGGGYGGGMIVSPGAANVPGPNAEIRMSGPGGGGIVAVAPAAGLPPAPAPGLMGTGGMAGNTAAPRPGGMPGAAGAGSYSAGRPAGDNAEQHLERLDRQLRDLMDQVRQLRELQERQRGEGDPNSAGTKGPGR